MSNEELERRLLDLERKHEDLVRTVDKLRADSLQQFAPVIVTREIRILGDPDDDYYKIGVDNSDPALPLPYTINVGKRGI